MKRLACALVLLCASPALADEQIVAIADGDLFRFDASDPAALRDTIPVTGLAPGESLVAIDFRPLTGQLLGLATVGTAGSLYSLNLATGEATLYVAGIALGSAAADIDVNPVFNTVRIVDSTGTNARVTLGKSIVVDVALGPGSPTVAAAAYHNDFPWSERTTLYAIDTASDELFIQGGANVPPGLSANTGILTSVGPLGVDTTTAAGFDVSGATGTAYAALHAPAAGGSTLFSINLATGDASPMGTIGDGSFVVDDIAVPEPGADPLGAASLCGVGCLAARRSRKGLQDFD
jgi:Domain of unknown function (DUF4394)